MPREEFEPNLEALANEELTGAELREVLKRLSVAEFGGSDHPSVAAVCEATGATPLVIGRMLAEIRQQNLHELFGKRIDRQDQILQDHAEDISDLRSQIRKPARTYEEPDNSRGHDAVVAFEAELAVQERREVYAQQADDETYDSRAVITFIGLLVLVMVVAFVLVKQG